MYPTCSYSLRTNGMPKYLPTNIVRDYVVHSKLMARNYNIDDQEDQMEFITCKHAINHQS